MGEAGVGKPFEKLIKELADTRTDLMAMRQGNVTVHKPNFDIAKPPQFAAKQNALGWRPGYGGVGSDLMEEYCKLLKQTQRRLLRW
jgi:hypothetical protein